MITNTILDDETLLLVSQTFKALSDPTRVKILHLLCTGRHSVGCIAETLSQSIFRVAPIKIFKES